MALPTVAHLKAYLRVETTDEDAQFTLWLARATALIEGILGRPITAVETVVIVVPCPHPTTGRYRLMLPAPFSGVALIDDEDVTVASGDYTTDGQVGFLTFADGVAVSAWYTATVTAGWSAQTGYATKAEPLIAQAITDTVADWYQRRNPAANMETESSASVAYATYLPLPPRVVATLDPLLRKGIR